MMSGGRRLYAPGTWIWIPDAECVWRKAEVLESIEDGDIAVKVEESGVERIIQSNIPTYVCNLEIFSSEGLMGLDDLTQLTHLHEPAVLNSLNLRFDVDNIYTFTGPILIAVNPFKTIPGLYELSNIKTFLEAPIESPLQKRIPHVFATGAMAFRGLCSSMNSQTILISGESGAGKTESTKFVMKMLALAGSDHLNHRSQIENQVLQSNPLLEALGNAKTSRNDNSSRFGKFIEMQFTLSPKSGIETLTGSLAGARIHTYLLETVRVCHQLEGERNYHSFYQLCAAAATTDADGIYRFPNLIKDKAPNAMPLDVDLSNFASFDNFRYLTKSSCSSLQRIDDVEEFEKTILAMQTIGILGEDQVSLWNVIGAVLYLGNIQFETPEGNSEGSQIQSSCRPSFQLAAYLLGVEERLLETALTIRTIIARTEKYKIPLKIREAEVTRDALAKALYGTTFLKIVEETNRSIGYRDDVDLFCGVVDIFGFECFQYNSFEQLCINFTNERLQQFFNTFIFKFEEQLYMKESISWSPLDFPDNQDCVDLMEQINTGIFAMLDEECIVPRGSDRGFCYKIKERHKDNKRFGIIKTKAECFVINHFAGPVEYNSDGFLDKNRDQLSLDSQACIKGSSIEFVRNLFTHFLIRGGGSEEKTKRRNVTVSSEFRNQLNYLMETVAVTEPHFIRCIKPNPRNQPDEFDRISVTEQLRYGGVLQAVQVSRAGYPVRLLHLEAYLDYRHLCDRDALDSIDEIVDDNKEKAKRMLEHLDAKYHFPTLQHSPNSWAVGNTMVFFKHQSYEVLSSKRAALRVQMAICIQSKWKAFQQKSLYLKLRTCAVVVQAHIRGHLARRQADAIRKDRAARRIQASARTFLAQAKYQRLRTNVITIQSSWRGYKARVYAISLRRDLAAQFLQACWKGYKQRTYYQSLKRGTQKAQLRWRQILAKRQLRRLRQEQRETAALMSQKQKLQEENKVLKEKVEEISAHLSFVVCEKDRLSVRVADQESEITKLRVDYNFQQESCKAQIEALREQTRLKRFSSTSASIGRRVSLDRSASVSSTHPLIDSPNSTTLSARRLPSTPEEVSCDSDIKKEFRSRSRLDSMRTARLPSEDNSSIAQQLEKAIADAHAADAALLQHKNAILSTLEKKVEDLEIAIDKEKAESAEIGRRYQILLKNEELKASSFVKAQTQTTPLASTSVQTGTTTLSSNGFSDGMKVIDILIVGDEQSGKAKLIENLMNELNVPPSRPTTLDSGALIKHHRIEFKNNVLIVADFLDTSANSADGVRNWAFKSKYVIIVYDIESEASYVCASWYMGVTSQHPHRICFGNRSALDQGCGKIGVNLAEVKDNAARSNCAAVEGSSLSEILNGIWTEIDAMWNRPSQLNQTYERSTSRLKKSPLSSNTQSSLQSVVSPRAVGTTSLMSRIRNPFGNSEITKLGQNARDNILKASVVETLPTAEKEPGLGSRAEGYLKSVVELPGNSVAITCIAFGRERENRDYYLLATASKDGSVTIYKIDRIDTEKAIWDAEVVASAEPFPHSHSNKGQQQQSDCSMDDGVRVAIKLFGHTRAITHLFFSHKEDQLVTTSIDKTVRFWDLETGDMLKVFADSTSCLAAAYFPSNPNLFVVANANSILRVVDVRNGQVLQKLRAESEVRAIKFDETGLYCYAGSRAGMLYVLDCSDCGLIQFKLRSRLSQSSITCITYVPSSSIDSPPQLFVNSCDSTITIVDCIFGSPTGFITTLMVKQRIKIQHSLLPIRSCYSSAGSGWLISGSEDKNVHIFSLGSNAGHKSRALRGHQVPVVTVAVNAMNTVLASADASGKILLWRWIDCVVESNEAAILNSTMTEFP